MPVSRFLIPLVSTVWIFSVMGGMGMHVLAEQPTEVQAVRRQFSTLEEVTAVQVQEEGSTVRFLPGEGEEVCVRYADTTAEALYEIQVENGTLVVQKLKAPPPKLSPSTERLCSLRWTAPMTWRLSCPSVSISRSL